MNFGLRVKDANGTIRLDTSDIVARIRYFKIATANSDGSVTLPDISGKTTQAFTIPTSSVRNTHSVSIIGTTFSWTAQSDSQVSNCDSLVGVIIRD